MVAGTDLTAFCVRSVLATSVKILPYRPSALLMRANKAYLKTLPNFAVQMNILLSLLLLSSLLLLLMRKQAHKFIGVLKIFFSALKPKRPMLLSKRGHDENQALIGCTRDMFSAQIFHV